MKLLKIASPVVLLMFLGGTGCGGDHTDAGSATATDPSSIQDKQGSYAYDIKVNDRCEGDCDPFKVYQECETSHQFTSKKTYCQALTDQTLNQNCARSARKQEYLNNCAQSFEETNVGGMESSGGDERLGSCEDKVPSFSKQSQYCDNLKDESVHNFCRWDQRRILFKQEECMGAFSDLTGSMGIKDNGTTFVQAYEDYLDINYVTYKVIRKTFTFAPEKSTILSLDQYALENVSGCEQKNKTRVTGELVNLNSGIKTEFQAFENLRSYNTVLKAGEKYAATIDVYNDGLCSTLNFKFNVNLK